MKNVTKTLGILAAGVALGCGSAAADDEANLLDTLVENQVITEEQAAKIRGSSEKKDERTVVTPKRDNTKKFVIRGRAQFQFGYVSPDSDIPGAATNDYSTLEVRRLRLGAQGELFEPLKFNILFNVLPEDMNLDTLELVYTGLDAFDIGMGYKRAQLGMEVATSSTSILTVERSYTANYFDQGRSVGVWGTSDAGPFELELGIFNGESENDNVLDTDGDSHFLYLARLGFDLGDFLPENVESGIFFDTIQNQDNDSDEAYPFESSYSLGAELEIGGFALMGNVLWGTLTEDDNDITGFVVMPSYFVTPKLQAVAQYSYLESDKGNAIGVQSRYIGRAAIDDDKGGVSADVGNESQSVYLGANYYISGNDLKVMGGVDWTELTNTSGQTAVDAITVYGALRMRF